LIDYGSIELGRKSDLYENILFPAKEKIKDLIELSKVNKVVIEDIQQQNRNVGTYRKLAMLMGVLLCLFKELGMPFEVVPPTRWKSFCKIKGKKRVEQKENTVAFVQDKFKLSDLTEDMADAISLGYYAVSSLSSASEHV